MLFFFCGMQKKIFYKNVHIKDNVFLDPSVLQTILYCAEKLNRFGMSDMSASK